MENTQLTKYKKDNFFEKFKNKIKKIFSRKKEFEFVDEKTEMKANFVNKTEVLEVYKKFQNNEITTDEIKSLDIETLKMVLRMMSEELQLYSDKIHEKIDKYKIHLDNAKMCNKEAQVILKNM